MSRLVLKDEWSWVRMKKWVAKQNKFYQYLIILESSLCHWVADNSKLKCYVKIM